MLLAVSVYLIPYVILLLSTYPSSYIFILLCGALVVLVPVFYLGRLALLLWLPLLPYVYYMWLSFVYFAFVSCFFPPESPSCDDVLSRLLSRPLPFVCFLPCLLVLFCFSPTVFVPVLFWCNFLYLVTTARFVADQL